MFHSHIIVVILVLITVTVASVEEEHTGRSELCPTHLKIVLHTRSHPEGYDINIHDFLGSLQYSPIDVNKETKFFSWTPPLQNSTLVNLSQIINDYITKFDINFIVVKWNTTFNFTDDTKKYEQMYDEAECLSSLLKILYKMGANPLKFHLIAHDFKVTVFSMAGQMAYPVLVGRLSALDPSRDIFSIYVRHQRSDIKIPVVDVIYTSLSINERIPNYGHVIFFPNGGYHPQPGVSTTSPEDSGARSVAYWAESIRTPDLFWSLRCNDWIEFSVKKNCLKSRALAAMGENVSPRTRGYFYLTTNDKSPYGIGKERPLQSADTYYVDEYE